MPLVTHVRALLPHQPQGLGGQRKILEQYHLHVGIYQRGGNWGWKVWPFYHMGEPLPGQVHSMEDAVRELTTWVSSGPHWPYALVWLKEDTHHVPLPKEGHLGILPQGGTNMTACGSISQLEVCQFLASGLQVAYPVRLNGGKDPIITSLPESLANGISLTGGGSIYLELDIPQSMVEELDQKVSSLGRHSSILIASPLKTTPPKLERSA